ncbi:hypothetical protein THIOM_001718 [Candidatus Thiomargarita nelsonii]|uniref:Uncharacterized protein n=1 Tax=Candidatus Thiomargarita nelsonii TaxID=1003181 RepID=A0A176S3I4_9GAMM|nr:hypothetical protein THIOM_001718 [Candidatus Thiomargarita nelsonii]
MENDKAFFPPVGKVNLKFDLFAEDEDNRIVVEVQHAHRSDTYERFLYYHLCAMMESIKSSNNYSFPITVVTLVFFTDRMTPLVGNGVLTSSFKMKGHDTGEEVELFGKEHKLVFVFTTYYSGTDDKHQEWMNAIDASMKGSINKEHYDNPNLLKMFEIIKEDNLTPDERAQMKEEYNRMEDLEIAHAKGEAKGLEKAARNLLALGSLSVEEIASVTGLSVERVKALSA